MTIQKCSLTCFFFQALIFILPSLTNSFLISVQRV
ncbi:hypothetical protein [Bacillus phage FI_KG-Lek]|nr:hypothetical protein [Bacillus phage FI_KG-Lek]